VNTRSQSRSAARLAAVQALYQHRMEGTALAKLLDEFHQHRLGREIEDEHYAAADVDFFDDLVGGTLARSEEIAGRRRAPSRDRRRGSCSRNRA
jgi:N utilization substance protein B